MSRMPPTSTTSVQGIATTTTRRIAIAASCLRDTCRGLLISPGTHVSNDNHATNPANGIQGGPGRREAVLSSFLEERVPLNPSPPLGGGQGEGVMLRAVAGLALPFSEAEPGRCLLGRQRPRYIRRTFSRNC